MLLLLLLLFLLLLLWYHWSQRLINIQSELNFILLLQCCTLTPYVIYHRYSQFCQQACYCHFFNVIIDRHNIYFLSCCYCAAFCFSQYQSCEQSLPSLQQDHQPCAQHTVIVIIVHLCIGYQDYQSNCNVRKLCYLIVDIVVVFVASV